MRLWLEDVFRGSLIGTHTIPVETFTLQFWLGFEFLTEQAKFLETDFIVIILKINEWVNYLVNVSEDVSDFLVSQFDSQLFCAELEVVVGNVSTLKILK